MSVRGLLALDLRHSCIVIVALVRRGLRLLEVCIAALSERIYLFSRITAYDRMTPEGRVSIWAHLATMLALIYWIFEGLVTDWTSTSFQNWAYLLDAQSLLIDIAASLLIRFIIWIDAIVNFILDLIFKWLRHFVGLARRDRFRNPNPWRLFTLSAKAVKLIVLISLLFVVIVILHLRYLLSNFSSSKFYWVRSYAIFLKSMMIMLYALCLCLCLLLGLFVIIKYGCMNGWC